MGKYIEIGQYGVGIIRNDAASSVAGIITKNLEVCIGIALTSANGCLLMHIDTNMDTDKIAEQMQEFCLNDYSLHLGYDQQRLEKAVGNFSLPPSLSMPGFINRLSISLRERDITPWESITHYKVPRKIFGVTREGQIVIGKKPCINSPKFRERKAINFLNYLSSSSPEKEFAQNSLDLAYNAGKWTDMPDLSVAAMYVMNCFQTRPTLDSFISQLIEDDKIPLDIINHLGGSRTSLEIINQSLVSQNQTISTKNEKQVKKNTLDPEEWTKWMLQKPARLRSAANRGDFIAQYALGKMHKRGLLSFSRDLVLAAKWYESSANQGYCFAQHDFAVCYEQGDGVAKNAETSVKWYKLAAEQGYVYSQHNLAINYANGDGVNKDSKKAAEWYKRAALNGLDVSQYNYGIRCLQGDGVTCDKNEAKKWFLLAAKQGHSSARQNIQFFATEEASYLQKETNAFFNSNPNAHWKKYPDNRLTTKYAGHHLQFFTMKADSHDSARMFAESLREAGFDVQLKSAKEKPSIVVDLTTSSGMKQLK